MGKAQAQTAKTRIARLMLCKPIIPPQGHGVSGTHEARQRQTVKNLAGHTVACQQTLLKFSQSWISTHQYLKP